MTDSPPQPTTGFVGRVTQAITDQHTAATGQPPPAKPIRTFLIGAARNLAGLALLALGLRLLRSAQALPVGASIVATAVSYGLAALVVVLGLVGIMPNQTFTVLRFFGLGDVLDKFLKKGS